jgi:two-component system, cell cycle response regulator CtrA
MRVLLIKDDSALSRGVQLQLQAENMVIDASDLGEDGIELAKLYDYDIILLDLVLPDMDGVDVVRRLRNARVTTPVMMLSGLSTPDHKVRCLAAGADDYLTKPFDKRELSARIHAIVRRSNGHAQAEIVTGRLTVNFGARSASVDGTRLPLTGKEYGILELLSLRKGTTLAKEIFLNHLYGGLEEPELKIVDVFICKLRKKLIAATKGESYIETVWGRGYMLRDPERPSQHVPTALAA